MNFNSKLAVVLPALFLFTGCTDQPEPVLEGLDSSGEVEIPAPTIDQRSYRLGSIGAFAEMVGAEVKELALSAPMTQKELDALVEAAQGIAAENGAELYLEPDFLVTDLFSPELTNGKQVLLIYRGQTLERYQGLKAEKRRLEEEGRYQGEARLEIARRFGRLLSYSDERIEALLAGSG
ncbi:MAG: hypothetical protein HKO65_10880 [Gemmatimonadetes bacterium]|nr:hypothetical protein [Gemmatimonadota bacterium]NNM05580.1 hypothetical protein [Gemmatimonadota bacterium]